MRQFLAESLLIVALGGAAGLLVSALGASVLIDLVTTSERRLPIAFTLDSRILLFTATISVTAAVLFGLVPALQANRTPLTQATQSGTRTPSRLAGGRLLIGAQMAVALFLLVGAGLFHSRGFWLFGGLEWVRRTVRSSSGQTFGSPLKGKNILDGGPFGG